MTTRGSQNANAKVANRNRGSSHLVGRPRDRIRGAACFLGQKVIS